MPYYINSNYVKNNNLLDFTNIQPDFTLDSVDQDDILPILPSNSLSLIISLLTNVSLFYILKPYVLINMIYMITIPLFQTYI